MSISLGQYVNPAPEAAMTQVLCETGELKAHVQSPWFRAYLAERVGPLREASPATPANGATVPDAALARHALLCGTTGSGKSRLLLHLITEQLARGCSAVVIDPKGETVDRLLAHLQQQEWPPERVTLLDPRQADGVPGWNPFAAGVPLTQAVADFVTLLAHMTTSWGPRLQDLLTNAALLVGSHRLSLYELTRLLVRDDYRAGLLRQPVPASEPVVYGAVHRFFVEEFEAWSRSDRVQAVAPVMNKVRELLRSPFLRPLFCARRTTLELARLWQQPQLVLVRLDRTALGEEGARLLAGLLCHTLLQTALRSRGPVPVVLAIDELPMLERFVGGALTEIVAIARSQRLRLLVACQHLAQISEELRAALLANAAVQLFFQLGHADAKLVAASLAAGTEERVARVVASIDRRDRYTGAPELARRPHRIRDAGGKPLQVPAAVWQHLRWNDLFGRDPVRDLQALAKATGFTRLYVRAADTGEPVEISHYIARLAPAEYWIEGPALSLVVVFPRPRLTGVERWSESEAVRHWTGRLQELAVQHAVLRLAGRAAGTVRVVDVSTPAIAREAYQAYCSAALRAHGQSRPEIEAALREREEQVERWAGGRIERKEVDDGSLF